MLAHLVKCINCDRAVFFATNKAKKRRNRLFIFFSQRSVRILASVDEVLESLREFCLRRPANRGIESVIILDQYIQWLGAFLGRLRLLDNKKRTIPSRIRSRGGPLMKGWQDKRRIG